MMEMINQKKKFYVEQKVKARRRKPMTQAQQRDYMSTFIKNQSSWKLTQLKKRTFNELKTEFEKLVKSIENFVPIETDERKRGKIRKQKARKGIHIDKTAQDESEEEREAFKKDKVRSASSESEIGIDAIPTATKPHSIVDWKIIPTIKVKRPVYQNHKKRSKLDIKIIMGFSVAKKLGLVGTGKPVIELKKDRLSVGFANTQQMVISSPCLTHQELASPKQNGFGKDFSNPLMVDSLPKTCMVINAP
ncbi:hypothetical protein Tco_0044847 [Tanacetum coccineum]